MTPSIPLKGEERTGERERKRRRITSGTMDDA